MALRASNTHYRISEIQRRHFNRAAQRCGLGNDMESIIAEVIDATPSILERVAASLPATFPGKLFDTIASGMRKAAAQLEAMPPK